MKGVFDENQSPSKEKEIAEEEPSWNRGLPCCQKSKISKGFEIMSEEPVERRVQFITSRTLSSLPQDCQETGGSHSKLARRVPRARFATSPISLNTSRIEDDLECAISGRESTKHKSILKKKYTGVLASRSSVCLAQKELNSLAAASFVDGDQFLRSSTNHSKGSRGGSSAFSRFLSQASSVFSRRRLSSQHTQTSSVTNANSSTVASWTNISTKRRATIGAYYDSHAGRREGSRRRFSAGSEIIGRSKSSHASKERRTRRILPAPLLIAAQSRSMFRSKTEKLRLLYRPVEDSPRNSFPQTTLNLTSDGQSNSFQKLSSGGSNFKQKSTSLKQSQTTESALTDKKGGASPTRSGFLVQQNPIMLMDRKAAAAHNGTVSVPYTGRRLSLSSTYTPTSPTSRATSVDSPRAFLSGIDNRESDLDYAAAIGLCASMAARQQGSSSSDSGSSKNSISVRWRDSYESKSGDSLETVIYEATRSSLTPTYRRKSDLQSKHVFVLQPKLQEDEVDNFFCIKYVSDKNTFFLIWNSIAILLCSFGCSIAALALAASNSFSSILHYFAPFVLAVATILGFYSLYRLSGNIFAVFFAFIVIFCLLSLFGIQQALSKESKRLQSGDHISLTKITTTTTTTTTKFFNDHRKTSFRFFSSPDDIKKKIKFPSMMDHHFSHTPLQILEKILKKSEEPWKAETKKQFKLPIIKRANVQQGPIKKVEYVEKTAKCLGCCLGDLKLCQRAVVWHLSLQITAVAFVLLFTLMWWILFKRFLADRKEIQTRYANEEVENEVISFPSMPFSRVDPLTFVPVLPCDQIKFTEIEETQTVQNCCLAAAVNQNVSQLHCSSSNTSDSDFVSAWMVEYRAHRSCLDEDEYQFMPRGRNDSAKS